MWRISKWGSHIKGIFICGKMKWGEKRIHRTTKTIQNSRIATLKSMFESGHRLINININIINNRTSHSSTPLLLILNYPLGMEVKHGMQKPPEVGDCHTLQDLRITCQPSIELLWCLSIESCQRLLPLASDVRIKPKLLLDWIYYKLQVYDQLKTEELLLSDPPTYTTYTAHRPFVSTWVLPRMLDKTT